MQEQKEHMMELVIIEKGGDCWDEESLKLFHLEKGVVKFVFLMMKLLMFFPK